MNELLSLRAGLLDLLLLLDEEQCPLILGGGFGLFLRREHLRQTAERTLLERWPEARSTNDLDLFLRPELLCDSERVGRLSQAIRELGYSSIPGCEHYQFRKDDPEGNIERGLKIDLLTGPESLFDGTGVRTGARRAKPRLSVDLHAHTTNEAVTLVDYLQRIHLTDTAVAMSVRSAYVWLPHPFTYLVMKLFAFRDRRHDVSQDRGSHHALDLYSIVAMTTESQWDQSCELRRRHSELPAIIEAAGIVQQLFSASDSLGMLILQGNPYCVDLQLEEFRATLLDLFRAS